MARRFVRVLVYEFPLIHLTVSMLGNTTFAIGSVLFLRDNPLPIPIRAVLGAQLTASP